MTWSNGKVTYIVCGLWLVGALWAIDWSQIHSVSEFVKALTDPSVLEPTGLAALRRGVASAAAKAGK